MVLEQGVALAAVVEHHSNHHLQVGSPVVFFGDNVWKSGRNTSQTSQHSDKEESCSMTNTIA